MSKFKSRIEKLEIIAGQIVGQPLDAPPLPMAERWMKTVLEPNWDYFRDYMTQSPNVSRWQGYGWTREKLQGDCRLSQFEAAYVEDASLLRIWTAIEDLHTLWALRWNQADFVAAQDALIDAIFAAPSDYWCILLDRTPNNGLTPLDNAVILDLCEFERDDLFLSGWLTYSIAIYEYQRRSQNDWYSVHQRFQFRQQIAIYKAFKDIRAAWLISGMTIEPMASEALEAALQMSEDDSR